MTETALQRARRQHNMRLTVEIGTPFYTARLSDAIWAILDHLEAMEQQETPPKPVETWCVGPSPDWTSATCPHGLTTGHWVTETLSSLPVIEKPEDGQSGSSTSSRSFSIARADPSGESSTATITFPEHSSIKTPGDVLRYLQAEYWTVSVLPTWGLQSPIGATPSTTPEAPQAGLRAGGDDLMADGSRGCYHSLDFHINGRPTAGAKDADCSKCGMRFTYSYKLVPDRPFAAPDPTQEDHHD